MPDGTESLNLQSFCRFWLPPLLLAGMMVFITSSASFGAGHTQGLAHWLHRFWPLNRLGFDFFHLMLRKGFHVISYGILYFLWFRPLYFLRGSSMRGAALRGLGLCLLVGIGDEIAQSLSPGRQGQVSDVILDLAAASLAALVVWRLVSAGVWGETDKR